MDWMKDWNQRYDRVPEEFRFGLVVAAMLLVGAINMLLTIHAGFPFGLLLLLAILFVAGVRLAYVMEVPPAARGGLGEAMPKLEIGWLHGLNRWYDSLPEDRQFWVLPVVLLVAGFINMMLTLSHAFPFGLLFLLVVLALVALRLPYARGWVQPPDGLSLTSSPAVAHSTRAVAQKAPVAHSMPAVTHEAPLPTLTETPVSEPAPMPATPQPLQPPAS
jgi:hypothetical protein